MPTEPSLFFFEFRIVPWAACVNLNFDNAQLPEQFSAVCTRDLLGLQTVAFSDSFDQVLVLAQDLATSLIDAHAYFAYPSHPTLGIEPVHWFEVKESGAKSTVFGYSDLSLELAGLIPDHPDNAPFRKAFDLMAHMHCMDALGLALADFRAARRQRDSYSAFYAYRVLEDIGNSFGRKNDRPDWDTMNEALGTSKEDWKELTIHSTSARHLLPGPERYLPPEKRRELLTLAQHALDRWIDYLFKSK